MEIDTTEKGSATGRLSRDETIPPGLRPGDYYVKAREAEAVRRGERVIETTRVCEEMVAGSWEGFVSILASCPTISSFNASAVVGE